MALRIGTKASPPAADTEDMEFEEAADVIEEMPVATEVEPLDDTMSMGGGIVDPAVARYFGPESRCGGCIHFLESPNQSLGACEVVAGEISSEGICSLFTPDVEDTTESVVEEEDI